MRRGRIKLKDCILMWGDAKRYVSRETKAFLESRKLQRLEQSPYSPDLDLCDRFLFQKLKSLLFRQDFDGHEEMEQGVKRALEEVTEEELCRQLFKLQLHAERVIAAEGAYLTDCRSFILKKF